MTTIHRSLNHVCVNILFRYFWKVELIETIKNTAADPPATLPASTNQRELHNKFEAMKGQRVLLTGRFDHSKGNTTRPCPQHRSMNLTRCRLFSNALNRGFPGSAIRPHRLHRWSRPGDGREPTGTSYYLLYTYVN
jgi:hypothetical protein